jgi:hypothetical protein
MSNDHGFSAKIIHAASNAHDKARFESETRRKAATAQEDAKRHERAP